MITGFNRRSSKINNIVRGNVHPKKLSLSIPYKQRIENIEVVFEALVHQTMHKEDFEVIIGAMDYCERFVSLCKSYIEKLNIITVLSPDEFSIPHARNLAMRQATGQVVVQMDADTLLLPDALKSLYERYYAFDQRICIIGQVVGYGNNEDGAVESVEVQPYENYKNAMVELENSTGNSKDPRFQVNHALPWAFGWTGFISIPLDIVRKNNLYFDETFKGWGVDDLEWSYRVCKSGIPIILSENIRAIHLPHVRDPEANNKTEAVNYRRFLTKWPNPDVELAYSFGDVNANSLYLDFMADRQRVLNRLQGVLGVAFGDIDSKKSIIVGVQLDEKNKIIQPEFIKKFDESVSISTYPLIGMGLPFADKEFEECIVLEPIDQFSEKYASAVYKEVNRVSKMLVMHNNSQSPINKVG